MVDELGVLFRGLGCPDHVTPLKFNEGLISTSIDNRPDKRWKCRWSLVLSNSIVMYSLNMRNSIVRSIDIVYRRTRGSRYFLRLSLLTLFLLGNISDLGSDLNLD